MPLMDNLRALPTQLKEIWQNFTKTQKILIIGSAVGLTLALILGVFFLTRPEWGLLYSGLDPQTAGEIIDYLKQQKIPYKVGKDGSIYVQKEKVPEIRMEIASKGLVGGTGPGFELFDKEKLGITEFQERIDYQRALEGELARTIRAIKGVKFVRVHIVLPKESVFIAEEQPAKASILIAMKPGYSLTKEQVKGIINLVSGAVPNLDPQNINIIDATTGKSLYIPEEEETMLPVSQLVLKKRLEYNLKNKIEELLSKALGYGKVIAQVSVDLSYDKEKIKKELYDPEASAIVSEQILQEKKYLVEKGPQGVAGVKGALVEKFEATTLNQTKGIIHTKSNIIRNYEVGKTIQDLEILPGQIKRISVAVLVDKDIIPANDTEKLAWIENLVKGAIGYNPDRGDLVSVEAISFIKPEPKKPTAMDYVMKLYKPLLAFLLVVLFFIFVVRPVLKSILAPTPPEEKEEIVEKAPKIEEEIKEEPLPKEMALSIIQSQPEKAAMLVKKWLMEESLEERKKALAEAK